MSRFWLTIKIVTVALFISFLFRVALYFVYLDYFGSLKLLQIAEGFLLGIKFDVSIVLLMLSPFILLLNLPFRFLDSKIFTKTISAFSAIVISASSVVLASNLLYFGHVKRHLGHEFWIIGEDAGMITDLAFGDYLFATFLLAIFSIFMIVLLVKLSPKEFKPISFKASLSLLLLVIALSFVGIRGNISRGQPMGTIVAFEQGDQRVGNLAINGLFSAIKSKKIKQIKRTAPSEEVLAKAKNSYELFAVNDKFPFLKKSENSPTNYNVVILALESWSYRYIDALVGNNYQVTPNLDAIIEKSLVFDRAYSTAQRSIDALQGILVSVAPLPAQDILGYGLERSEIKGIGDIASELNYRTLFVQSSVRKSFKVDSVAKTAGYTRYFGKEDIDIVLNYPDDDASRFGWDYETLQFFGSELSKLKEPFTGFVFTGTTHIPYAYPGKQFEKYPHSTTSENGFLNTLFYADYSLGEFLKAAEKEPWFDNTIFIITADHPLGAYALGKSSMELDDALRVPLVFYAPKIIKPERKSVVASHLDILPTVVDLMGYSGYYSTMGESLLRKTDSFALAVEGQLLVGISDNCHIYHSIATKLKGSCDQYSPLESRVLLYDYLGTEAIKNNRWYQNDQTAN